MERDIALRLDMLLTSCRGQLNLVSHFMKDNLTKDESRRCIRKIGASMGELCDISNELYVAFPDIIPKELKPGNWVERQRNPT